MVQIVRLYPALLIVGILFTSGCGGDSDSTPVGNPVIVGPGGTTIRVSVGSEADDSSFTPSISSNGRFIAFASDAMNLIGANDTNGIRDIFIRDRDKDNDTIFDETGVGDRETIRVSIDSSGNQVNDSSSNPSISSNGRFIAFASVATDLIGANDTNGVQDIFIHDRDKDNNGIFDEPGPGRDTVRVSIDSSGNEVNDSSSNPSISSNGRFIAFASVATDLIGANDTNGVQDIFIHDRDKDNNGIFDEPGPGRDTVRVSIDSSGNQVNDSSSNPSISSNGRFIAFASVATDLIGANDTNGVQDIFIHDRDKDNNGIFDEPGPGRDTVRVSIDSSGNEVNDSSSNPSISSNGRFIAFASVATDLIGANDTNGVQDIFIHDRDKDNNGIFDEPGPGRDTVRISVDSSGNEVFGSSSNPSINSNGRFAVFQSSATSLVSGDTNGVQDIFIHDRDTDNDSIFDEPIRIATFRLSIDTHNNQSNDSSANAVINSGGNQIAFESDATNLVTGDANGVKDIFVRSP